MLSTKYSVELPRPAFMASQRGSLGGLREFGDRRADFIKGVLNALKLPSRQAIFATRVWLGGRSCRMVAALQAAFFVLRRLPRAAASTPCPGLSDLRPLA